ncbi:MAG: type II toxin-antitoxin system RelE/ParE family toxin [Gammaproteobacteria bacterium]|nr:type II toxin-antitoxin system RelE/ParE family toxin [Gammaproteobacteria bacterium]
MISVHFTRTALDDLTEIRHFYTAEGAPEVGARFVAEIFEHVERLQKHPDIGRVVPEFGNPMLRELIHVPFRVVYWREKRRVSVIRVWRSERLMRLPGKRP